MIIKKLNLLDIQKVGDSSEGTQAGIDLSSIPFVLEILSTKFYSNPIGSIIREITSNCFDAHEEVGISEPIIISKLYDEEEGYSIAFQDFGVGLSPERMYGVYMKYFSSTKRDSNVLIGGFGLGSKTPLSYANYFYIDTIFDGIKYEYLYHKGTSMPTLECLNGYEEVDDDYEGFIIQGEDGLKRVPLGLETEEGNGTTIRIVLEERDVSKFKFELGYQLTYFDSVYFENWNMSNQYDIYEGKYFKFRSDIDQRNTSIHLCIGRVRYPIDFGIVSVLRSIESIPVGIKFEIGELEITPNRESIRYDERSIELIRERIDYVVAELTDMYNNQNPEKETLAEYIEALNETVKITFNKEKNHGIELWSYSDLDRKFKFKPLSGLNLKKTPTDLFFGWEKVAYISRGIMNSYSNTGAKSINNNNILNEKYVIIDKGEKFSKYTDLKIHEDMGGYTGIYVIRKKDINFMSVERALGIGNSKKENGKARLIYNYNKIIENIVKENSNGTYKSYRPTDEWIAAYKKRQIEDTLAHRRKMNKTVFVREVTHWATIGKDMKLYDLNNRTGILVYGFREDKSILQSISDTVSTNVRTMRNLSDNKGTKAFLVLQISKSIETNIVDAKRTIYCQDFVKTKFYKNILSARWLRDEMADTKIRNSQSLKEQLIPGYREDMYKLNELTEKYCYSHHYVLIPDNFVPNKEFKLMLNEMISKYGKLKIPLINTINQMPSDETDKKDYIDYLKSKKVRLLNVHYIKDSRQLEYEEGVVLILNIIKNRIKPQLLLTLNQNENDNNNEEETSSY